MPHVLLENHLKQQTAKGTVYCRPKKIRLFNDSTMLCNSVLCMIVHHGMVHICILAQYRDLMNLLLVNMYISKYESMP